jgi:hydroxymethylpyrimidine pyrophosphatase-like HAD family hydrolase
MTPLARIASSKISAVLSDVDGTLVTDDKLLNRRTRSAVAKLHASRIAFGVISARPTRGLLMLRRPLAITTPLIGFNGGVMVDPDLAIIAEHLLSPEVARRTVALLTAHGAKVWVFGGRDWLLRHAEDPYVSLEKRTVGFRPTIVEDFGTALDVAAKIVGVSTDFALLARCEHEVAAAFADHATVVRSQVDSSAKRAASSQSSGLMAEKIVKAPGRRSRLARTPLLPAPQCLDQPTMQNAIAAERRVATLSRFVVAAPQPSSRIGGRSGRPADQCSKVP